MPYTARQERMLHAIASGNRRSSMGPSRSVARKMLRHSEDGQSLFKRRKKEKDTPNEARARKRRRKTAIKKAFDPKGYKREGGIWDKIKHRLLGGATKVKEEVEKKKKDNPGHSY